MFKSALPPVRTIVATLAVLCVAAVLIPGPVGARSVVDDLWNWREIQDTTAHEVEHTRRLEIEDEEIQKRIDIKEVLIADLIAGRTTLAEVTSEFLRLNQGREVYMITLRRSHPDVSDEEMTARNVIDFTAERIPDPSLRATILANLERDLVEFRASLDQGH